MNIDSLTTNTHLHTHRPVLQHTLFNDTLMNPLHHCPSFGRDSQIHTYRRNIETHAMFTDTPMHTQYSNPKYTRTHSHPPITETNSLMHAHLQFSQTHTFRPIKEAQSQMNMFRPNSQFAQKHPFRSIVEAETNRHYPNMQYIPNHAHNPIIETDLRMHTLRQSVEPIKQYTDTQMNAFNRSVEPNTLRKDKPVKTTETQSNTQYHNMQYAPNHAHSPTIETNLRMHTLRRSVEPIKQYTDTQKTTCNRMVEPSTQYTDTWVKAHRPSLQYTLGIQDITSFPTSSFHEEEDDVEELPDADAINRWVLVYRCDVLVTVY